MDNQRKLILCLMIFALILSISSCDDNSTQAEAYPPTRYEDYIVTWSEANGLIAYFHSRLLDSDDPDSSGIYIINPDGTNKYLLYKSFRTYSLDWSNDGRFLVVNSGKAIVRISFPSGNADTLTGIGEYWGTVWSPSGNSIAYTVRTVDSGGIYIMNVDNGVSRRAVPDCDFVDWPYPDSLLYLNVSGSGLFGAICMSDTAGIFGRVVLQAQDNIIETTPEPRMHIATRRVAFQAQLPSYPPSIWRVSGTRALQLRTFAICPSFSPDGNQIVFADIHENNGKLWIINWDGSGARQLTY